MITICGIFGFIGEQFEPSTLAEVAREAGKRGPHGFGFARLAEEEIEVVKHQTPLQESISLVVEKQTRLLIGNARLATFGSYENIHGYHPHSKGGFHIVHNGNVYKAPELIERYSLNLISDSDSEVIVHLIALAAGTLEERVNWALREIDCKTNMTLLAMNREGIVAYSQGHSLFTTTRSNAVYLCSRSVAHSEQLEQGATRLYALRPRGAHTNHAAFA